MEKKDKFLSLKKKLMLLSLALGVTGTSLNNNRVMAQSTEIESSQETNEKTPAELIKHYSDVFGIKEQVIYDVLDYKTNELSEPYEDNELTILNTARELYDYPEQYGYTSESVYKDSDYEMSMEIEEAVEYYANLENISKEVALAIVYCECGSDVDSENYLENNNPAGIGPFYHFKNKEVGVIEFIKLIKYDYGCSIDSGEGFLNSMASVYSGGTGDYWLSLTVPFYYYLCEDYYYKKPELKAKHDKTFIYK